MLKRTFASLVPAAIFAGMLAGCTSTYVSPVEVTRFTGSRAAQLGTGTIAVRAAPGGPDGTLEFSTYANAVAEELAALGYRVVRDEGASQVAELRFGRFINRPGEIRSPVNVGVGGSTGSYGSGVGVGVGIDLSGPPKEMIDSNIAVIIRDNATGQALWEGRAQFRASQNSDYASQNAAAQRLASALFSGFPGESGETIEVK
ncbi:hypothetical protein FHS61_000525 [Altererythrobacter atlanticus]|uniref:DUF4136 domain-containing protein n=1 Tax=Croceibacterium atlanticum TaxID=1267766 RepID=A0A0F7KU95_9SPHN|nr:DUF4136 domain-containing protein [Croceibacterium atlanticum]AKH42751.1 hypothetical protein WYH_01715 [Croceibacterium atlanticum]MBB5731532.1 hypothetical protein [Croceibacterium atlanticum]